MTRYNDEFDVPVDFGILGLYMVADTASGVSLSKPDVVSLPTEVIYIGMSRHIDRRIDLHDTVEEYLQSKEPQHLWLSTWYSEWSMHLGSPTEIDRVKVANLMFLERGVILSYAQKHNRLPVLNRM